MMAGPNPTHVHFIERGPDDIRFLEEVELLDQVQQHLAAQGFEEEYEEEEEEEEADEEEEEEDEDDDEEDEDYVYAPGGEAEGSWNRHSTSWAQTTPIVNAGKETKEGKPSSPQNVGGKEVGNMGELNRGEVDGLFCPICIEAWTNDGDHQICCLPCGHIYGMSCIKKWFQRCGRSSGKCPQCNRSCTLKDVRKLYASRLVVADEGLQKKVQTLEARCATLEKKDAEWSKKEAEWRERELHLNQKVIHLTEVNDCLHRNLDDMELRSSQLSTASRSYQGRPVSVDNHGLNVGRRRSCRFMSQKEFPLEGGRFFDIDTSSNCLIIARRLFGMSGRHVLTRMSLIPPYESEDMPLPSCVKAVRDLCVSPYNSLALVASLGKKLSVLSTESNTMIHTYDLPAAAWSCSWDPSSSYYLYAGLQNGMVSMFDTRQTARPVESMFGLTSNPVHSICPLSNNLTPHTGTSTVLTASSVGLCHWNFGGVQEGPFLVPETENAGVCISLAYSPKTEDVIASFRPKVEITNDISLSQPLLTPSSVMGHGVHGSHVHFKRLNSNFYEKVGCSSANVNDIRLPKSAIVDKNDFAPLFACGDEVTQELVLQELPSLKVNQRLKSHSCPIRDLKFTDSLYPGLLGCLSEGLLQIFSAATS